MSDIIKLLVELKEEPEIQLNWEHTDYRWISTDDLESFDIIPDLKKVVKELIEG